VQPGATPRRPLQCTTCKLASLLASISYFEPEGRGFESLPFALIRRCALAATLIARSARGKLKNTLHKWLLGISVAITIESIPLC